MDVWFRAEERFEKVETDRISVEWIKQKMNELGLRKARVVSWHPQLVEPNEWGVVEI